MSNIMKKISITALCMLVSSVALAEAAPHWVKVGSDKDSSFSINTVIDPE